MRPALLRLLKRPSAVSTLHLLLSTPIGVEQLDFKYRCVNCQSRKASRGAGGGGSESISSVTNKSPESPARHYRQQRNRPIKVYEIERPQKQEIESSSEPLWAFRRPWKKSYKIHRLRMRKQMQKHVLCMPKMVDPVALLDLHPEALEFESDVGHADDIGSRLIDDPVHSHNFALWEELLRYRKRRYGDKGTLHIWKGLTVRLGREYRVQLPVNGERADFLWGTFVELGLERPFVLSDVANYARWLWEETGARWNRFYESVVGGFLARGMTDQAVEWHQKLRHPHLTKATDVVRVLESALSSVLRPAPNSSKFLTFHKRAKQSPGLRSLKKMCVAVDCHTLYSPVITKLLQHGQIIDALAMHKFFVNRNVHPATREDIQPLLDYAAKYASPTGFEKLREYAEARFPRDFETAHKEEHVHDESDSNSNPEGWVKEKPFKDEFGARLFATNALNFEMIVAGLQMFGVPAIGAHSLREMAIRAQGSQDILNKLKQLQKHGITIKDSVFSRLVRKLASENRGILLADLLRSDQHPDVLEDAALQESLLVQYYMARDWRPYNMTLAVLGEVANDGPEMYNVHFRKYIAAGEWASAAKMVDEMSLQGKTLTRQSLDFMFEQVLTPRRRGARPPVDDRRKTTEQVAMIFQTLQRVIPAGAVVPPELWVELLKRLGLSGGWNILRECCLWLVRQYSYDEKRTGALQETKANAPQGYGEHMLKSIFSPHMQGAIVAWGFMLRSSSEPDTRPAYKPFPINGRRLVPWVRGLVLLRELGQNGVDLEVRNIRRACRYRLAVLFGRPRHSSRRMNRLLRRENRYGKGRIMDDISRAWGSPLFEDQEAVNSDSLVNPRSSNMSSRRTHRTVWREANLTGSSSFGGTR